MTQGQQLLDPVAQEDDLSKWIDVENLFPDEDNTQRDLEIDNGRVQSPIGQGAALPPPITPTPTSDPRELTSTPQCPTPQGGDHDNTALQGKRKHAEVSPRPSEGLLPSGFSIICFPSDPARPDGKKKKRRDFNQQRRLEVAQVRKQGACLRCKIRRISVDYFSLGQIMCTRLRNVPSAAKAYRARHAKGPPANLASRYAPERN